MERKKIKVGLPKALLYHKYGLFWETFFKELNCEVIISPETNQDILSKGVNLAVDESCLSLKIFLGHIDWLKDKVDYILVPHIISPHRKEQTCVKIMALYDIVKNTFDDINLLEYTLDADTFKFNFFAYMKLGFRVTKNPFLILRAYLRAKKTQNHHQEKLIKKQSEKIINNNNNDPTILIVSHPYTTYDGLLGKPISKFLEAEGVNLLYSDLVLYGDTKNLYKNISADLYWSYNKELLGAIEYYKDSIDGIIFLMTFPCGPDSLVINLCQSKLKIPMTLIILDELQGEAGLKTRIESFVDILKIKKKHV
ncbi:hypothetical protein KKA24_03575 [Patescibacteria group bacterium]|nr:hypothetical protein [Patescibacteria group bacterium]